MLEPPRFVFDWKEIYAEWRRACEEHDIEPQVIQLVEYDFDSRDGDLFIYDDCDWIPLSLDSSRIGPKRTSMKGYPYYVPRAPKASEVTLSLLMRNLDNEEALAGIWIMACALQLDVDFPSYWRGMHNKLFLNDLFLFCRDMDNWSGHVWGPNSKRIFPNQFFSKALLETIDYLTVPQFVRLAALNAKYYLSEWLVVRYTIDGISIDEYREKSMQEVAERINLIFSDSFQTETEKVDEVSPSGEGSTRSSRPECGKPKLLVPNSMKRQFHEGGRRQRQSDGIERNVAARKACLEHYGLTCVVCGMNFEEAFGKEFAGIIDVHHIAPISQREGDYLVDPITDLVPLCPNCHRMVHHRKDEVYLPDELRDLIKARRNDSV